MRVKAYVDGSYLYDKVGYGAVIVDGDKILAEISGQTPNVGQRQITGEIYAAMAAVDWAEKTNLQEIEIVYDYIGVSCWANGSWRANNDQTKFYASFMQNRKVKISYLKIKGHSNDKFNDHADSLAKLGTSKLIDAPLWPQEDWPEEYPIPDKLDIPPKPGKVIEDFDFLS